MSRWLPAQAVGASPDDPRAVTACRGDRWHRGAVLDRREGVCELAQIYLDPWIRGRSRFGPRS